MLVVSANIRFLLGPTHAVVDEYADNIARLDHLKSLQRR